MCYNFSEEFSNFINIINCEIDKIFENLKKKNNAPDLIIEGMKYAVLGGGKRVRPVLALATAKMLNLQQEEVLNFAIAIEFIHSYSLVHDDLPAMDNDDYRRGQLSTHKKFGEANGILIGDALLNYAFELVTNISLTTNKNTLKAINIIADCSGYSGMIAGQVLDLYYQNNYQNDEKILFDIYQKKTGKLLSAPILCASQLADGMYFDVLQKYSYYLGLLFQFTDDILDCESNFSTLGKTPNKDDSQNKFTSVKLFGLDGAKQKCKEYYENALNLIKEIPNNEFLLNFTSFIYNRKS